MITDDVQTMLFEAATFDGTNIRKTTKKIGLRTDASGKFEKGLDPDLKYLYTGRAAEIHGNLTVFVQFNHIIIIHIQIIPAQSCILYESLHTFKSLRPPFDKKH